MRDHLRAVIELKPIFGPAGGDPSTNPAPLVENPWGQARIGQTLYAGKTCDLKADIAMSETNNAPVEGRAVTGSGI